MSKILPINYPPVIDCYAFEANLVSIVSTNQLWDHWLFTNFIGLRYRPLNNEFTFDRCTLSSPFRNCIKLLNSDFSDSVISVFIDYINKSQYIMSPLDHYYISGTDVYQKHHKLHDLALIYGYDLKEKCFFAADNFEYGKYICLKIPFKHFIYAFQKELPAGRTLIVDFNSEEAPTTFDINKLIAILINYINGKQTFFNDYFENNFIVKQGYYFFHKLFNNFFNYEYPVSDTNDLYGIHLYSVLRQYVGNITPGITNYDFRWFHVMCNHKMILELMITYLNNNNYLLNYEKIILGIKNVKSLCLSIRNLMIKTSISNNQSILPRIYEKLIILEADEYNLIQLIIEDLNNSTK